MCDHSDSDDFMRVAEEDFDEYLNAQSLVRPAAVRRPVLEQTIAEMSR